MQSEMCFRKYSAAIHMENGREREGTCSRDTDMNRSRRNKALKQLGQRQWEGRGEGFGRPKNRMDKMG